MEISWSNINSSWPIIIMVGRSSFQAATSGMATGGLVALARVWVSFRRICALRRPWRAARTPHRPLLTPHLAALQEIDASRPRGSTRPHFHSERPQSTHLAATTRSSTKSTTSKADSLKNSKAPESRLQQALFLRFIQIRSRTRRGNELNIY